MKEEIEFVRVATFKNEPIEVDFVPYGRGKIRSYKSPSEDSLYRLLNNSMVGDICPFFEKGNLWLEVFPKYKGLMR